MHKLKTENIQFIDRYLTREIIFTDTRAEIVDHVASAIEQKMNDGDQRAFYYIFKDYMIENKKVLLRNDRRFLRSVDNKVGRRLLKNVFSLKGIVVFLLCFSFFNIASIYLEKPHFFKVFKYTPMIILGVSGLIYIIGIKKRKERYSAIERIGIFFVIISQFVNIFFRLQDKGVGFVTENMLLATVLIAFLITLIIMLLFIAIQYKKEYKLKFRSVL